MLIWTFHVQNLGTTGVGSLHEVLVNLGGWPTIDPNWDDQKFDFARTTATARRLYGHSPFFTLYVHIHPKNRTRNTIYVSLQPGHDLI